jgi:replicative DNA helicase Mcm
MFSLEQKRKAEKCIVVKVDESPKSIYFKVVSMDQKGEKHDHQVSFDKTTKNTEILTEDGWKYFKNISYHDKIATLNPYNERLEYHNPSKIIIKPYSGKMYHIKSPLVNLLVTPNHKLFVKFYNRSNKEYHFETGKSVYHQIISYKRDCVWFGKEKKNFTLRYKTKILKINMNVWLEFLGLFLSEGCATKHAMAIYQSKESKYYKDIKRVLKKMPFEIHETVDKRYGNISKFTICSTLLSTYLNKLGKSDKKYIPKEFKNLSKRQINILIKYLTIGDGHISNNKIIYFASTSKKLADDFQELLLKAGYSGNIRIDNAIGKKGVFGTTNHLLYKVQVIRNKNRPRLNSKRYKKIYDDSFVRYSGRIYCVTVPNHIIYVRRKGIPCWCGNCTWCSYYGLRPKSRNKGCYNRLAVMKKLKLVD